MTLDEILVLQPGPKMDALVGEQIMRECRHEFVWIGPHSWEYGCVKCGIEDRSDTKPLYIVGKDRPYSTDISAAWEVEKEMDRRNLRVAYTQALQLVIRSRKEYATMFDYVHASPADRCKAALLVVTLGAERFEGMARAG